MHWSCSSICLPCCRACTAHACTDKAYGPAARMPSAGAHIAILRHTHTSGPCRVAKPPWRGDGRHRRPRAIPASEEGGVPSSPRRHQRPAGSTMSSSSSLEWKARSPGQSAGWCSSGHRGPESIGYGASFGGGGPARDVEQLRDRHLGRQHRQRFRRGRYRERHQSFTLGPFRVPRMLRLTAQNLADLSGSRRRVLILQDSVLSRADDILEPFHARCALRALEFDRIVDACAACPDAYRRCAARRLTAPTARRPERARGNGGNKARFLQDQPSVRAARAGRSGATIASLSVERPCARPDQSARAGGVPSTVDSAAARDPASLQRLSDPSRIGDAPRRSTSEIAELRRADRACRNEVSIDDAMPSS